MLETAIRVQMRVTKKKIYKNFKMNRRQLVLGLLVSILVLGVVRCNDWDPSCEDGETQGKNVDSSALPISAATPVWKLEKVVVVTNSDKTFYRARIQSKDFKIRVVLLDSTGKTQVLKLFDNTKNLVFIDAIQNYILVKEVASDKTTTVNFWVVTIEYDAAAATDKYSLSSFSVNPFVDTNFKKFVKLEIKKILQLDINGKWIAVLAFNDDKEVFVFKINIKEKLNALIAFSWFELCGQNIIGGNSRVLYDRTANAFLINQYACSSPYSATKMKKLEVSELTGKTLAATDVVSIINLEGAFFQFFALSADKKSALTFLFRGYGEKTIKGLASLTSTKAIKTITDNFHFFIAITDKDIYLTNVFIEDDEYHYFAGLMSSVVPAANQAAMYKIWSNIEAIVFIKEKFFFISEGVFYVFKGAPKVFRQVAAIPVNITKPTKYQVLFAMMKANGYP